MIERVPGAEDGANPEKPGLEEALRDLRDRVNLSIAWREPLTLPLSDLHAIGIALNGLGRAATNEETVDDEATPEGVEKTLPETRTQHYYEFYGRTLTGSGPSMDPHRCGDESQPCRQVTEERTVTPWRVTSVTSIPPKDTDF